MIHLQKFENFDWDEDDFDFEEEYPDNDFKIGDIVKIKDLKKPIYWWDNRSEWHKAFNDFDNNRKITEIRKGANLGGYQGTLLSISGKWPYYRTENIEVVN